MIDQPYVKCVRGQAILPERVCRNRIRKAVDPDRVAIHGGVIEHRIGTSCWKCPGGTELNEEERNDFFRKCGML